jgi:hypothetical protein
MEEISRQPIIQAIAWILLVAFNQICSENWEQKSGQKDLKNLQFGQRRSMYKDEAKESVAAKRSGLFKRNQVLCTGVIEKLP